MSPPKCSRKKVLRSKNSPKFSIFFPSLFNVMQVSPTRKNSSPSIKKALTSIKIKNSSKVDLQKIKFGVSYQIATKHHDK